MIKEVRSWSKPKLDKLIGRKKVDWSIFKYGSQIPYEFHDDFAIANANHFIKEGERVEVELIINEVKYGAEIVNLRRPDSERGSLQIRFSSNQQLKNLLREAFSTSYKYFLDNREEKTKKLVYTPDEIAEYMEFYETVKPYVYQVNLISADRNRAPLFWWVNQGKAYKPQKEGGFLWAPQKSKQGVELPYHVSLLKPRIGDIVFCYSNKEIKSIGTVKNEAIKMQKPKILEEKNSNWQEEGYLLKMDYYDLYTPIPKEEIPIEWRLEEEDGPFDKFGSLKMGYFYSLSGKFARNLYNLLGDRFPEEVRNKLIEYELKSEKTEIKDSHINYLSSKDLINHIHSYIKSKGFHYEKEEVINLFLSLKTKPFVILSGISGTGKTKMVQWFAESLGATEENGQFSLIPIRPDWNDGSDLLGYVDIKGEFKEGPLTKVIKTAEENPTLPYFVLLDEMNLARVEYYFSDILSVMESRKWVDGKIVSSNLISKDIADRDISLPNNLYVIGTVNMDETTHPFSKKVLDRANTIEFNRVELDNLSFLRELEEVRPIQVGDQQLASKYLHLKDVYQTNVPLVERVTDELVNINNVLQLINAHVGYRVRDEICFYMAYNEDGDLMTQDQALDHCILQKILPRLTGSDSRVERVLQELYKLFTNKEFSDELELDVEGAKYPNSAAKVEEMLRRLREDGFTSFWIS